MQGRSLVIPDISPKTTATFLVVHQCNGQLDTDASQLAASHVAATIQHVHGIDLVPNDGDVTVHLTINNVYNPGSAMTSGFITGYTLGLHGSTVTDYYQITATCTTKDNQTVTKSYNHALLSTIGNAPSPVAAVPTTAEDGYRQIVEQVTRRLINELVVEGVIPS